MKKIFKHSVLSMLLIVWVASIGSVDGMVEDGKYLLAAFLCVVPLLLIGLLCNSGWLKDLNVEEQKMNKNVCIAKGCPFYYCSSSTKYKNGTMDIGKRYMCKKFLREIKDIVNCKQILVSCLCSVARDEQPNIFFVIYVHTKYSWKEVF